MKFLRIIQALIILMAVCFSASSQVVVIRDQEKLNADSIRNAFDHQRAFGLYKDNYFTIGTSLGQRPSDTNSDVKYQVSISHRLTNSVLPWHSYLYLFFSQRSLWNVFQESMPFHDLNFNPGIGWAKLLFSKGQLVGKVALIVEHESNGRAGESSRSWNKISLSGSVFLDPNWMVHGKFWIPIIDGQNNKDILKYSGIYQTGIQGVSPNKRWVFDLTYVKRKGWNLSGNVILNVGYRLHKGHNQFLMLHYYNGYGETMLDYNDYHSRLRVGLLIRPNLFSDF